MDAGTEVYGTTVGTIQTDVSVTGNKITGTLNYIENGLAPSGYLAGSGYFLALHLDADDWSGWTSVKVGLDPSIESGLVEISTDDEKIVVCKITSLAQKFVVQSTDGTDTRTDYYSLSGLTLAPEQ